MALLNHTLQNKVNYTLAVAKYACHMSLDDRIKEVIDATKLDVADLAKRIGVTRQAVYDWKKGKSLANMKAENLVELANVAGYEPAWIIKARGPKKRTLTKAQEQVLKAMQESPDQQQLIAELVESVVRHHDAELCGGGQDNRRREQSVNFPDRRKNPFDYGGRH